MRRLPLPPNGFSRPRGVAVGALWLPAFCLALTCWAVTGLGGSARAEGDSPADAAIQQRLAETDRYLSSDELEGRGLGAKGLDLAADFIAKQFHEAGLRTDVFGGSPFQTFKVTTAIALGPDNRLTLVGPPESPGGPPSRLELVLNRDFTPTVESSSGKFDLPLVFIGYGITAKPAKYDDYAGVQVAGKAVLLLRHKPQQANPESVFNGVRDSEYSFLRRKISTAYEHGAAVVIVCTDLFSMRNRQRGDDALLRYRRGPISHVPCDIPVVHVHRAVMDRAVRGALGTDLAGLESQIDNGPAPHSRPLAGWRIAGKVDIHRTEHEVKNVLGMLDGTGPTADETIIVGAHYDHLGCTLSGDPLHPVKAIYHGADDNASGVAVMTEIGRSLAHRRGGSRLASAAAMHGRLHRRVLFIAFTGEETGHLGSKYYVAHPRFPLDRTPAMLNFDMLGRLRDDTLIVKGAATAADFARLLEQTNRRYGFRLTETAGGYSPTDQATFYARGISAMDFFTGRHADYHEPSDTFDKLNLPGMVRIEQFVEDVTVALADGRQWPTYVALPPPSMDDGRCYFGSIPDLKWHNIGYALAGVDKGSPAERAGLQGGDVITQFGQSKIEGVEDFDAALRTYHSGQHVLVAARRHGKPLSMGVTLTQRR